jgi:hypothetical protein
MSQDRQILVILSHAIHRRVPRRTPNRATSVHPDLLPASGGSGDFDVAHDRQARKAAGSRDRVGTGAFARPARAKPSASAGTDAPRPSRSRSDHAHARNWHHRKRPSPRPNPPTISKPHSPHRNKPRFPHSQPTPQQTRSPRKPPRDGEPSFEGAQDYSPPRKRWVM